MLEFKVFRNQKKKKFMCNLSSMIYIFMFFPIKIVNFKKKEKVFELLPSYPNNENKTDNNNYCHLLCDKTRTKKDNDIVAIFFCSCKEKKKMTKLLPLSSLQQKKIEKVKKEEGGGSLPFKLELLPLGRSLSLGWSSKLSCISAFLSSPRSFGDGGQKKEAKLGGRIWI